MGTPVFFGPGRAVDSPAVAESLDVLARLTEEKLDELATNLPLFAEEYEAASSYATSAGMTTKDVSGIIGFAIGLHVNGAANDEPVAVAAQEAQEQGLEGERLVALRRFVARLAEQNGAIGAYIGGMEAGRTGMRHVVDAQVVWSLRAAFGEATYRDREPRESAFRINSLRPFGLLTLDLIESDDSSLVFEVEPKDVDRLISALEIARQRLAQVESFSMDASDREDASHGH